MARCRRSERLERRAVLAGAVGAVVLIAAPDVAAAGNLFDLLFGAFQHPTVSPPVTSYAEPPPPAGQTAPGQRGGIIGSAGDGGRFVAFCVRLCDGQHFPLDHNANATPVETCRAMCPTARTKIFFGTEIDHAVARDGARYADLDNAYVYRDHLVANCTCNGKDAFGLTAIDVKSDPTLRPGDIVSTAGGLMTFAGRTNGHVAEFTPVDAATQAEIGGQPAQRLSRRGAEPPMPPPLPPAEDEAGTIVPAPTEAKEEAPAQVAR